jgi:hypothetical protein
VKQDAAIADIAPKQLPVEQRKVRISRSRNRRGDADGCAARSVLRFGDRGDYSGHESNEIRAARAEGTVAPAGTARAPARGCRLYARHSGIYSFPRANDATRVYCASLTKTSRKIAD